MIVLRPSPGAACFIVGVAFACFWPSLHTRAAELSSSPVRCTANYIGDLVLVPQADGRLMRLKQIYEFKDSNCRRWIAPAGALVDGASIPGAMWSIVGGPFEGRYRNASVLHDWYCITRTRPWREVHRMFFEGMLISGVPRAQAQLLYAAVYLRGPRWDEMTIANARLAFADPSGTKGGSFSTPAVREAQRLGKIDIKTRPIAVPQLEDSTADALKAALGGKLLDVADIERIAESVDKR